MIDEQIKEAEKILRDNSFEGFCDKINEGFQATFILSEWYKSGNEEVINILNEVENGG